MKLVECMCQLTSPRLLVLGDVMLDYYTWGDVARISPEAPVMVLRSDLREARLGGAASVAFLAKQLGAEITLAGVIGNDHAGRALLQILEEADLKHELICADDDRPTTTKDRLVGRASSRHPHQILRVDSEVTAVIDQRMELEIIRRIASRLKDHQALLISDYDKGVCTRGLLHAVLTMAAEAGIPVLIDPARLKSYELYRFADIITPNRFEAELVTGTPIRSPEDAVSAAKTICHGYNCDAVVVTLDRDGMALSQYSGPDLLFPTRVRPVYDVTGAGDTVLAMLGLCIACAVPLPEAIQLANIASGIQVERLGVAAVTQSEVIEDLLRHDCQKRDKLVDVSTLSLLTHAYRRTGRRIVFTNGCFDLLHIGHLCYLREAARLGDVLIVAVNSNDVVRKLKGLDRPVIDQQHRAKLVGALDCVDHVVLFEEETPHRLLHLLQPDVLVKGADYTPDEVVGRDVVGGYGGRVCTIGHVAGISTTSILSAIRASGAQPMNS